MSVVGEAAQRYLDALTSIGWNIGAVLAPPAAASEVRLAATHIGFEVSDSVVEWFGWHNGIDGHDHLLHDLWLVPWKYPLSMSEAVEYWPDFPEPGMFPLFTNDVYDFWALPITDEKLIDGDKGVFRCDPESHAGPSKAFDSILTMLETLQASVAAGAISCEGDRLRADLYAMREIAAGLNPKTPPWPD